MLIISDLDPTPLKSSAWKRAEEWAKEAEKIRKEEERLSRMGLKSTPSGDLVDSRTGEPVDL